MRQLPENASCDRLAKLLDRHYLELKQFQSAEAVRIHREEEKQKKEQKANSAAVIAAAKAFRQTRPERPMLTAESPAD
jgi:hypothetical protein